MRVDLPKHMGAEQAELDTDVLSADERIVGWCDDYGTITDNNGERIGDLVSLVNVEGSALVLRLRGDQMTRWGWSVGDEALMDNVVPGTIDGFYRDSIVFKPQWKWGWCVWGALDRQDNPEPKSQEIVAFSTMLVHPSNLSKP